ncbi:MAG: tetratricopeptide repeat protein [Leptospiraceae bacterium]|nr:tetratricopeptide repeat protein [Leptospiraceae bacterium]
MKFIIIIFITCISIFPRDEDAIYTGIRSMIDSGNVEEANRKIESMLKNDPGDPTLTLYLTEIWIEKANILYDQKNLKSAFEYYEKAYKNWNSHPVVRKRYFELKDQKLSDTSFRNEKSFSDNTSNLNLPNMRITDYHNLLNKQIELNTSLEKKLTEVSERFESFQFRATLGIGFLAGMNLAIFLVLLKSKKNDTGNVI